MKRNRRGRRTHYFLAVFLLFAAFLRVHQFEQFIFRMEVKSANDGLLTNVEVLELLKEARSKREKATDEFHHREFVENETIKYISKSKVHSIPSEHVRLCLSAIKKLDFGLTEGEMIQIANLGPEGEVEYYLIIEDCQDRLSEEQLSTLKEIVSATFIVAQS